MLLNSVCKTIAGIGAMLLVGCSSTPDAHSEHGTEHTDHMKAQAPTPVIELIGIPGMDEPIPARAVRLTAQGLSCPLCAHNLDKQLMRIEGVSSARIDLSNGAVDITLADNARVTPRQLIDAVKASGFSANKVEATSQVPMKHEVKQGMSKHEAH